MTKKQITSIFIVAAVVALGIAALQIRSAYRTESVPADAVPPYVFDSSGDMKLTSDVFTDGGSIPSRFTCDGDDVNPPLHISNVPEGTESLALIVDDPDAPAGDWVHWLVWNIHPGTSRIDEGTVPRDGVEGLTDFNRNGWGGPCPPSGTHRYPFKLYALDTMLDLPETVTKKDLEAAMQDHILAQTVHVGTYRRSQ